MNQFIANTYQFPDSILWLVVIFFIVINAIFNALKAKFEKSSSRPPKQSKSSKRPQPFRDERRDDFFARLEQEKSADKKLKVNEKELSIPLGEPEKRHDFQHNQLADVVHQVPEITQKNSRKIHHRIDRKDRKALRKAIVINEVLARPKAYQE